MTIHTTGTMTWHESAIEANMYQLRIGGDWLLSVRHNGEQMPEKQRENVRRLAACWNACDNISILAMELKPKLAMFDMVSRLVEAQEQRDELLHVLRTLLIEYGANATRMSVNAPRRIMWNAARDAVAKSEGAAP